MPLICGQMIETTKLSNSYCFVEESLVKSSSFLSLFAFSFLQFPSTSLNSFSCICPCWLGGASQLFCCVSNYHFIKDDSFGGRGTVSTGSSGRSACQIRCMKGNYPSTPAIHHFVLGETMTLIRISGNCAEYISWYQ